ncbi:MAG: hypothetical protein ACK56F_10795, partial [bacterium]
MRVLLCSCVQREGMGLLEYQAMPSLRDVAHDGVLCPLRLGQMVWSVMAGGMDHPSRTNHTLLGHT